MKESIVANKDMEDIIVIDKWKGSEAERLDNLKYYYKKPDSAPGEPSFVMGNNRYSDYGEIIIGNEEPIMNITPREILNYLKSMTIVHKGYKTFIYQSWYFGKDNYKPARQAIIALVKREYKRALQLELDIPLEVRDIIENDKWPW